ncbi:CAP domain-containing protein [Leptothoe spongobia]|uniref:Calcium-binding protein n=1 Tax=Leptothoe spongobia TAU-MAC 1115 TaxID=1967444 RepID=A0A947DE77_9CYAN|nr:CAP domain-containing protein [Leptothoe spongobia]MBT9314759.1 calcium-binding protein [Leptothoe spongobia TAU-MAC 1115]
MQNQAFENEVLRLTNEFRKENGLKALVLDTNLDETADKHSKDMADQDYFSHTGKDGSKPWDRAKDEGYESGTVGENIAAGYGSAKAVVEGWKNSPGHRANMLNANYNEIGVGHYYLANDTGSVNYGHYWTQVFGKGTIENPAPNPEPTPEPPAPTPTPPSGPNVITSNNAVIRGTNRADKIIGGSRSQTIGGKQGNDIIGGKGGNDRIFGDQGADKLFGDAGNDLVSGGSGNDHVAGGSGNDRILGGTGSDKLVGGSGNDILQGSKGGTASEKDVMTGGKGRDTFILGNKSGAFYDDGNSGSMGLSNYALITDLKVGQGDRIQLSNDHDYRLGSAPNGVDSGRALFIDNGAGQQDELVAVIRGSGNLNLNSSTFQYV